MKRASITIPDDLDSRIKAYTRSQENGASLSAVVRAALEEYLANQERHQASVEGSVMPVEDEEDLHHTERTLDILFLEDLTQEELDELQRSLKITPDPGGSGLSDVSINHDKYLAEGA